MTPYKFLVGFVLTVAMIAVLGLCALVFSARDFQFGVAQISPTTNGLISFANLYDADAQITQIDASTAGPRGELAEAQAQVADLDARVRAAQSAIETSRNAIVGALASVEQRANIQAAANSDTQSLNDRVAVLASRSGLSPEEQQTVSALRTQVQQLAAQEQALDTRATERASLVARQELVDGQLSDSRRRVLALQQTVLPDTDQYARVRGEALALKSLSPLGVSAFLAQGHPALLSTLLVLLMGALGSLLYLFPAYLNRPIPVTMAEIVVRLIFGMCAALAFYVLANATVAGFSIAAQVQQAGTSSTLNPFTVSLIGIVAGVLSEDIAKWIQDRGRGIFTQGQISSGASGAGQAPAAAADTAPGGGLVNNQAIS
jgi:hypothetical protein